MGEPLESPSPYWVSDEGDVVLHLGDCLDVLRTMEAESVDAVVTDPPYGLEFMGKDWDAPWQRGINADAGFSPPGLSDGATRLPRPTFTGSTNPHCRNCGGRQRGRRDGTAIWKTCTCEQPEFPNVRAVEMRAFQEWCEAWARECLRVLRPNGYLLAFGGTRTYHRMACGIEDAGFDIRDSIDWLYGTGFPKNDSCLKPAHEPIVMARKPARRGEPLPGLEGCMVAHAGVADLEASRAKNPGRSDLFTSDTYGADRPQQRVNDAGRWPPNVVLGSAAAAELDRQSGVLTSGNRKSGTYGLMGYMGADAAPMPAVQGDSGGASRFFPVFSHEYEQVCALYGMLSVCESASGVAARSPLSDRRQGSATSAASASSSQPSAVRPDQLTLSAPTAGSPSGTTPATVPSTARVTALTRSSDWSAPPARSAGSLCGSCATAIARSLAATRLGQSPMPTLGLPSTDAFSERILTQNLALYAEALERPGTTSTTTALTTSLGCVAAAISACITRESGSGTRRSGQPPFKYAAKAPVHERPHLEDGTAHPTVKPVSLMSWLVRLVCPPGGLVLDPFAGSGTTAEACIVEGFRCILIEQDPKSAELIKTRLAKPIQPVLFGDLEASLSPQSSPVPSETSNPQTPRSPSRNDREPGAVTARAQGSG